MTTTGRKGCKTPELVAQARELRRRGYSFRRIEEMMGNVVSDASIKRWIDPDAAWRHEMNRRFREEGKVDKHSAGAPHSMFRHYYRVNDKELAARIAEIPEDTRTDGEKLLGTPIPQRSALYKKMGRTS